MRTSDEGAGVDRIDVGGVITGLFFLVVGVAFVFEATGAWDFHLGHLAVVGPIALILAGVGVVLRAAMVTRT